MLNHSISQLLNHSIPLFAYFSMLCGKSFSFVRERSFCNTLYRALLKGT